MGSTSTIIYSSQTEFSNEDFFQMSKRQYVSKRVNINKKVKELEIKKCDLRRGFSFLSGYNEKWKHHYVLVTFVDETLAVIDKTEQGVFVYHEFDKLSQVEAFTNPEDKNHANVPFEIRGMKFTKYNRFEDDIKDLTMKSLQKYAIKNYAKKKESLIYYDSLVTRFNCVGFAVNILRGAFLRHNKFESSKNITKKINIVQKVRV